VPESLEALLERIAAATPTPGGGTVSAICGALSAALSRMVANLAVGKQGYEAVQAELGSIESKGSELLRRFLKLADKDAAAYEGVVAAMRMPKASDAERTMRKGAMQAAYKRATEIPMETIRACLDALELAKLAARHGNRNAITDAGVAAILAESGMRGAALNVRINVAAISDASWRASTEAELESLLKRGEGVAHEVQAFVASKM